MLLPALLELAAASPCLARKDIREQLLSLEPSTRFEQRCDGRAAGLIRREHKGFDPDEVVGYAFADTDIRGSVVRAPGAAIRSHGAWYRVSYVCTVSPDGLDVKAFDYTLGERVPRTLWKDHYLVP